MLLNGKEDKETMALLTIDTNIIIQALAGNANAVKSIADKECLVSFMVVVELLSWKEINSQSDLIHSFLSDCVVKDNDASLQQAVNRNKIEIRA
jgi:hypothetical protein